MPERAVVCQHLPPPHLDILVSPEGDLLDLDIVLTLGLLGPGAGGLEELTEFGDVAGHTPGQVLGEGGRDSASQNCILDLISVSHRRSHGRMNIQLFFSEYCNALNSALFCTQIS